MHIHSSCACAWPEASCFSHSCRTASAPAPAACPAVGIGPAREMCHRSYQREARQWQRAGLTGRPHYDSFTCSWSFSPGWIESRSLNSQHIPTHPSHFPCGLSHYYSQAFLRARSLLIRICFYFNISLSFWLIGP
ncbi:hypothetical protein L211DRAFT_437816 [Terfezia boudieri ATCC MYA-4762]|uniref:Uncharacterized protein n=1 Tax=Terfezia boudieri ATCC MYA-4762 TaxID=1051890 RepID=A0A3N4LLD9_9PEZI|nr:hypothetical protein L211DRAFT_437816 [Terfezia boudieri ATCC MYA-4762]